MSSITDAITSNPNFAQVIREQLPDTAKTVLHIKNGEYTPQARIQSEPSDNNRYRLKPSPFNKDDFLKAATEGKPYTNG